MLRTWQAGVFLPQQFRVFHAGGQIFRDLAVRSRDGHHSCAVVFGSSTAGGAYHPALSDYTIFVEGQAQVFLGGPPLVKMATGETIDAEELGGAQIHASVTGLADQIASDESVFFYVNDKQVLTSVPGSMLCGRLANGSALYQCHRNVLLTPTVGMLCLRGILRKTYFHW